MGIDIKYNHTKRVFFIEIDIKHFYTLYHIIATIRGLLKEAGSGEARSIVDAFENADWQCENAIREADNE